MVDTAVAVATGITGLPADIANRLRSADPQVSGEALVDALAVGYVATAVTAKLGQLGYTATVNKIEVNVAKAAEAEAAAKERIENNIRVDDAQQYDKFRNEKSTGWDWQKQAPNDGAVAGTARQGTVSEGTILDRYGSRRGEYMSPAGTPLQQRSLPPGKAADVYAQYAVQRPFEVIREEIAPAFDQPGRGIQLRAKIAEVPGDYATIEQLILHGYLKVKP